MRAKKLLSLFLVATMSIGMLMGCTKKTEETTKVDDGSIQLDMWVHATDSNEGILYKKLAEEFNKEHKGEIQINLTQVPRTGDVGGYDDKINASITTNNMPDIFTLDGPSVAANADAGTIMPIGDYFDAKDLQDFNNDIIEQGTYDGKLYTLGCSDSSVLLYYNKDMFEAAGITPATFDNPWTWDEYYEAAKKLTKDGIYGTTMGLDSKDEWMTYAFLPLVLSGDGNIVGDDGTTVDGYLDGQATIDALNYLKKFVDNGVATTTPEEYSFEKGSAAMILSGTWEPGTLKDYPEINWGTMPYPVKVEGGTQASPCGTWTFGVSKDCAADKIEAAVEVVKYFTSADAATRMYEEMSMPPARTSAFEAIDAYQEAPLDVVTYQLQNTAVARPVVVDYPILSDQFAKAVANAVNGMDAEEALKDAVDQYNFQVGK